MDIPEFKKYLKMLRESDRLSSLLQIPVLQDPEGLEYIKSRRLPPGLFDTIECFTFEGLYHYRGKEYKLPKSIVFPLRDIHGNLRGCWLRYLREKRFFIWMASDALQKYWAPKTFKPNEPVFITEGIFDALSLMLLAKKSNVVACLGVQPSVDLIGLIANNPQWILALDNDEPGKKSTLRLLPTSPKYSIISPFKSILKDAWYAKDFNEVLKNMPSPNDFDYRVLGGIEAKVYLRGSL